VYVWQSVYDTDYGSKSLNTRNFHHFTSEHNKVSKSEVVEKVIPAADFWMSVDDMRQQL